MSVAGAMSELWTVIEAVAVTPAFTRVASFDIEEGEPVSSGSHHHYTLEVAAYEGDAWPGVAELPRVEVQRWEMKFRAFKKFDWGVCEYETNDALVKLRSALIDPASYAGSSHIWVILSDGMRQEIQRKKKENHILATLSFVLHVAV